jgi:hypothetical protein
MLNERFNPFYVLLIVFRIRKEIMQRIITSYQEREQWGVSRYDGQPTQCCLKQCCIRTERKGLKVNIRSGSIQ